MSTIGPTRGPEGRETSVPGGSTVVPGQRRGVTPVSIRRWFASVSRSLLALLLIALASSSSISGQDRGALLDGFMRYFEVDSVAMTATQQDSLQILAEINRAGRRTTPVSYRTSRQDQCRAAAVIVFALALRIVAQRGWTEDVEVDVTCTGFRSTMFWDYPESITLTDRRLPSGEVLFTKTRSRPPGPGHWSGR